MFTATLYNSTGFTLFNIPDSETTLRSAAESTKSVPTMDILQLMYNTKLTIRAVEEDVINADYLKLTKDGDNSKSAFYAINGYTMTSGDTIELDISMEPILTAGGIDKLCDISSTTVEGIMTRYFPDVDSNKWGIETVSTVKDEMFSPAYPTTITYVGRIINGQLLNTVHSDNLTDSGQYHMDETLYVISSVDIAAAKTFKYDIETSEGMSTYVDAGLVTNNTIDYIVPNKYDAGYTHTDSRAVDPLAAWTSVGAYPGSVTKISKASEMLDFRKDLLVLCANNMQNIITNAYMVPDYWVRSSPASSGSVEIEGYRRCSRIPLTKPVDFLEASVAGGYTGAPKKEMTFIPVNADEFNYMEPYFGEYNQLIFVATSSGAKAEYNIENLLIVTDPDDGPCALVEGMADPRPDGGVDFAVGEKGGRWFSMEKPGNKYKRHYFLQDQHNLIKGGGWYNMPISIIGSEGARYNSLAFRQMQQSKDMAAEIQILSGTKTALGGGSIISDIGDAVGRFKDAAASGAGAGVAGTLGYSLLPGGPAVSTFYGVGSGGDYGAFNTAFNGSYTSGFAAGGGGDVGRGVLAGNDRAIAAANRQIEKAMESAQYNQAHAPHPVVVSQGSGTLDTMDHSLLLYKRSLDARDIDRFTQMILKFGVRNNGLFQNRYLNNRTKFNYIEGKGIVCTIKGVSRELNKRVSDALNGGIRIWHVKPNYRYMSSYTDNPQATNGGN